MTTYVLAFSGKIASGKSTLSLRLAEQLNWKYTSFGDYVRDVAKLRGLENSRQELQNVGQSLIEEGWRQFCQSVLSQTNWLPGEPLVIDGIRHIEAIATLQPLVFPSKLFLIYVSTDEAIREARFAQRGEKLAEDGQRLHQEHSTEVQVEEQLPLVADLIVNGDKPIIEIIQDILIWLHM